MSRSRARGALGSASSACLSASWLSPATRTSPRPPRYASRWRARVRVGRRSRGRPRPLRAHGRLAGGARPRGSRVPRRSGRVRGLPHLEGARPGPFARAPGVATRPGVDRTELDAVLARLARPDRVTLFELQPHAVSSTQIRRRVAAGESIEGLVPPEVEREIHRLGIYATGARTEAGGMLGTNPSERTSPT